jgi:hypothetical protein
MSDRRENRVQDTTKREKLRASFRAALNFNDSLQKEALHGATTHGEPHGVPAQLLCRKLGEIQAELL